MGGLREKEEGAGEQFHFQRDMCVRVFADVLIKSSLGISSTDDADGDDGGDLSTRDRQS